CKSRLDRFCRDFRNKLIGEITTATLDNYVRAIPLSPKTRLNHRINIGAMFSYAESRGVIKESPMRRAARPKVVQQTPGILTPSETRALSEAAHREQPDMLPALAIGAFAGLRTEEIKRLERPSLRAQRN